VLSCFPAFFVECHSSISSYFCDGKLLSSVLFFFVVLLFIVIVTVYFIVAEIVTDNEAVKLRL